ncbi:MAG TPA: hypothetical protein VMZ01_01140 [Aestuariivirga sp.]|nr:hypothetical protein [Aestuariivirga sp.]
MDWARTIEINQASLTRIVAALIAMVGLAAQDVMARLPRSLYRKALRILRPAESAVRRLIIIAARSVVVKPRALRPMPEGLKLASVGGARASFQLFDSRKRFSVRLRSTGPKTEPRLFIFGAGPLVPLFQPRESRDGEPELDDGMVGAGRLGRRLAAIKRALENLPRQVQRLARWQARRDRMQSPKFRSPLRPGLPPGYRKEPGHEVDAVLMECHGLAGDALNEDTS